MDKKNNELILYESDLHHIKNVMRYKENDQIEVVFHEIVYICNIISLDPLKLNIIKEEIVPISDKTTVSNKKTKKNKDDKYEVINTKDEYIAVPRTKKELKEEIKTKRQLQKEKKIQLKQKNNMRNTGMNWLKRNIQNFQQ